VVDDHQPWRRFLGSTLQRQPKLQVIGEESDGPQAVQKAEELQPDLIVLDIGLPTMGGIEAAPTNPEVLSQIHHIVLERIKHCGHGRSSFEHRCGGQRRESGCGRQTTACRAGGSSGQTFHRQQV
jgi:DNA-binding NarL/FixJ family response regulator